MENMTWVKSDDNQWTKRIDNQTYTIVQIIPFGGDNSYGIDVQYIDLDDYTIQELVDIIKAFGYTEYDLDDMDGQVIAEMIVEYCVDKQVDFVGTYEECYEQVLDIIA